MRPNHGRDCRGGRQASVTTGVGPTLAGDDEEERGEGSCFSAWLSV